MNDASPDQHGRHDRRRFLRLLGPALALGLPACQTSDGGPAVALRNQQIAQEPSGNYFIGRRYWAQGSRVWGWVRKPREPWEKARLVIFNEVQKLQPDRRPEDPSDGGAAHGFDHNYEYKISGQFTGEKAYDPSSNLQLPEFMLSGYELISKTPGFLFRPGERYHASRLPRGY